MQVFVWMYVFVSLGYMPRSEIVFLSYPHLLYHGIPLTW